MNFFTQILHLLGSGATAYISARNLRDRQTRPNTLAALQLAESGSVPFLIALSERAAREGDTWLAERLAKHAADERRHGQIFAHALKQLNKQVIDFSQKPAAQSQPDDRQQSPFFAAYFKGFSRDSLSPDQIDWTVFMASTYILELDASKDFARMATAIPDHEPHGHSLKQGLLSVAGDETGHAAYLYQALQRRLSPAQVAEVIDQWRTRKVNALLAMVGNLVQKGGQLPSLAQDGVPMEFAAEPNSAPATVSAAV